MIYSTEKQKKKKDAIVIIQITPQIYSERPRPK